MPDDDFVGSIPAQTVMAADEAYCPIQSLLTVSPGPLGSSRAGGYGAAHRSLC